MKKRLLSIMLTICVVLAVVPLSSLVATAAGETGAFTVTGGTLGIDYEYADNVLKIKKSTPLTVKNTNVGTAATDRIAVLDGVNANITLAGVNIQMPEDNVEGAIDIRGNTVLTLAGSNTVGIAKGNAVLNIKGGLTVNGSGTLTINGGVPVVVPGAGGLSGYGIYAEGNLTVEGNVTVTVNALDMPADANLSSYGGLIIGNLTVGKDATLIFNAGDINGDMQITTHCATFSSGLTVQRGDIVLNGRLECYAGSTYANKTRGYGTNLGLETFLSNLTVGKDGVLIAKGAPAKGRSADSLGICFIGDSEVTVNGGSISATSGTMTEECFESACGTGISHGGGTLTLNGGSITINTGAVQAEGLALAYGLKLGDSKLNIKNGGKLTVNNQSATTKETQAENYGIYYQKTGIDVGTAEESPDIILVENGTLDVTAGEAKALTAANELFSAGIGFKSRGNVTLNGGSLKAEGKATVGSATQRTSLGIGYAAGMTQTAVKKIDILSGRTYLAGEGYAVIADELNIEDGKILDFKAVTQNGAAVYAEASLDVSGGLDIILPQSGEIDKDAAGRYTVFDGTSVASTVHIVKRIDVDGHTLTLDPIACTGETQSPEYTLAINGEALIEGTDYTVIAEQSVLSARDVGDYTIKLNGIGMYYGTITVNWSIKHSGNEVWTVRDESGHERAWSCCGERTLALEAHTTRDGVCERCGMQLSVGNTKLEAPTAETVLKTEDNAKSPKTGDSALLWLTLLFAGGAMLTVLGIYGKRRMSK